MPLKTSTLEELPSVNMTPMIDVVFLLIIFFMVGTQFTQSEQEIALKLPGVGSLKTMVAAPDRRDVLVGVDGSIFFDGETLSVEQLVQKLTLMRVRYPDLRVSVRADGDTKLQHMATVMAAVNNAGVADLSMAVRSEATQLR